MVDWSIAARGRRKENSTTDDLAHNPGDSIRHDSSFDKMYAQQRYMGTVALSDTAHCLHSIRHVNRDYREPCTAVCVIQRKENAGYSY